MRLVALLAFYDEEPATLHRLIRSLPLAGVDHLVALDGAYAMYPGATGHSPAVQTDAIRTACGEAMIGLTLEQPASAWAGNEIEKRRALFTLAQTITSEHDWYAVLDADEEITAAPHDLLDRLGNSWFDVAELTFHNSGNHEPHWWEISQLPRLFRAIRGLTCEINHYTYRTPDGRTLWGNERQQRLEPRLLIPSLHLRHHHSDRLPAREEAKRAYYTDRTRNRIETV